MLKNWLAYLLIKQQVLSIFMELLAPKAFAGQNMFGKQSKLRISIVDMVMFCKRLSCNCFFRAKKKWVIING